MAPDAVIKRYKREAIEAYKAIYISIVGGIGWAGNYTRPDLAYTYGKFSRYVSNPGLLYFNALYYFLRYVKYTVDLEMIYRSRDGEDTLLIYSDTDFAGCLNTKRSTGDYFIFKNDNLISW